MPVRQEKQRAFTEFSYIGIPGSSVVKNPPANSGDAEDVGSIPGSEEPLEEEMATRFSTLAGIIPWMVEPGRLQSLGSQRVGHDGSD